MKFSVCTNFQDDLIPRLNKKEVQSLYGKLTSDFIGGGRASYMLPSVSRRQVRRHIEQAHKNGLGFNYLLNSACLGTREFTMSGQRKIRKLLDWIVDIGADSVTVAIPYLARLIKKSYPQLKINVSSFDYIDTVTKARYWQDLGADTIVLPPTLFNRDFAALKKFRKYIKCKLQLLANNVCMFGCQNVGQHRLSLSHGSQSEDLSQGYVLDFCALNCRYLRLLEPVNFIRADWIRPEDVRCYEEIGIDALKIIGRARSADFIIKAVDAYSKRDYHGNLLDIIAHPYGQRRPMTAKRFFRGLRYARRIFTFNPFYIRKMVRSFPHLEVYLDNKKLDGFIKYFVDGKCPGEPCDGCSYCKDAADIALKIDENYRQRFLKIYKKRLDEIVEGRPFRYF